MALIGYLDTGFSLMNAPALVLLAISSLSLLMAIFLISAVDGPVTALNTAIVFIRLGAISVLCISVAVAASTVGKALKSSSMSTLMWRSIRETADEETAYEQMMSVNNLNRLLYTARNNLWSSAVMVVVGAILMASTYALEMLAAMGYI